MQEKKLFIHGDIDRGIGGMGIGNWELGIGEWEWELGDWDKRNIREIKK